MPIDINVGAWTNQLYYFLKTVIWGLLIIGGFAVAFYIKTFKYIIELNIKTGSGILVRRFRARKIIKDNVAILKPIRGKKIYQLDNEAVYRQGRNFLIRFFMPDELNAIPIKLSNPEAKFEFVPQDVLFIHKMQAKTIEQKYQKQQSVLEKYGQLIAWGILGMTFIIAIYFIMQQVGSAMELGKSVIAKAAEIQASQPIVKVPT